MSLDSFAVRALCAKSSPRLGDHFALRALLRAHHVLSLALGLRLGELRSSDAPDARRIAQPQELSFQLPLAPSAAHILAERWKKIPERSRPHYLPEQRFEILRVRASLLLSAKETARLFAISEGTVHRWEAELRLARSEDPSVLAIGEKLQPTPPVRHYADAVRSLVLTLSVNGFGGAANQFRLFLHTAAYLLLFRLREQLEGTALATSQMDTLRLELLKIGARVQVSARRIWFHLASGHPSAGIWLHVARRLAAQTALA